MKTREFLRELMNKAWMLVHVYGFTMADTMKQAWGVMKLRREMKRGVVKFYYTKVSGEVREAWGSLMESRMAPVAGVRQPSPLVQTYWDVEKNEFRCFKIANFLRVA